MGRAAKPTLITLVLSAAAVLGYLAYRFTLDRAPTSAPPVVEAAPRALPDELPEFSLANLDGELQSIRDWSGRPLLINFWATWCAPCRKEIPMLLEFQDSNPGLTVVGIAVNTLDEARPFVDEMGIDYPILVGRNEAFTAAASFGVEFYALPFTIFTDGAGRTLGVRTGELHQEQLDHFAAVLADLEAGLISVDAARARIAAVM